MFSIWSIDMLHSGSSEVECVPFFRLKAHRGGIDCSTRMAVGAPAGNPGLCSLRSYSEVANVLLGRLWREFAFGQGV